MTLSEDLNWRGLIKDKTFGEITWLDTPKTFYHGVDCSSDSLTVGNLAALLLARRLVAFGWQAVLLVGGATSLVGDPGGKTEERELKSVTEVEANTAAIQRQVERLFDGQPFKLVNNIEWLTDIKLLDFLREVGKHYSMSELTQRDFITERMGKEGSGISYAEFSYTLMQGYDFWHLFKNYQVELQIGGSDQWGNMLSGVPLVRKKEGAEVHALSMPLVIDRKTGRKFGKSEDGAVWLDPNKTTPYQFYQFWLNIDDDSAVNYLKIYTLLDKSAIEDIAADFEKNRANRSAQRYLAYEVTALVHSPAVAESVRTITEVLFGKGNYRDLSETDFATLKGELPTVTAKLQETTLVELLVSSRLAGSNTEARRVIFEGGVYINGVAVSGDKPTLTDQDTIAGHAVLRRGKNAQAIIQVIS